MYHAGGAVWPLLDVHAHMHALELTHACCTAAPLVAHTTQAPRQDTPPGPHNSYCSGTRSQLNTKWCDAQQQQPRRMPMFYCAIRLDRDTKGMCSRCRTAFDTVQLTYRQGQSCTTNIFKVTDYMQTYKRKSSKLHSCTHTTHVRMLHLLDLDSTAKSTQLPLATPLYPDPTIGTDMHLQAGKEANTDTLYCTPSSLAT
jgi:hypothetical protein